MKYLKIAYTLIFLFFTCVQAVNAGNLSNAFDKKLNDVTTQAGYSSGTNENTMLDTISMIIQVFLSLLGVVFLVLIIYGGYLWMMDQGNNDKMKKAQNLITAAVVGLIIVLLAYSISYFVFSSFASQTLEGVEQDLTAGGIDP